MNQPPAPHAPACHCGPCRELRQYRATYRPPSPSIHRRYLRRGDYENVLGLLHESWEYQDSGPVRLAAVLASLARGEL